MKLSEDIEYHMHKHLPWRAWRLYLWATCECRKLPGDYSYTGGKCDTCGRRAEGL